MLLTKSKRETMPSLHCGPRPSLGRWSGGGGVGGGRTTAALCDCNLEQERLEMEACLTFLRVYFLVLFSLHSSKAH